MPTEDDILNTPIPDDLLTAFHEVCSKFETTTNILQALEDFLHESGDDKAARLVEQATLKVCAYEAE